MSTDLSAFRRDLPDGSCEMTFAVDHVMCGACVAKIERSFAAAAGVESARVNLTQKRLQIRWNGSAFDPAIVPERLQDLGYDGRPFNPSEASQGERGVKPMLRYLAVAFFGAMNIMLLSVSVWSGNVSDISTETRDLFHWVSALIALPVAAYSGQPFYRSAWRALRSGHVNMDVPITLGVLMALALSLYETAHSARHAYFDSVVMLLFFLLAGRTLDMIMRERAQGLTANLLAMRGQTARRLLSDDSVVETPVEALQPGDRILVTQGDRIGADGVVVSGSGEIDQSLITGETRPAAVAVDSAVYAGSLNLGAPLTIRIERSGGRDFVEEIERLRNRAMAVKDKRILLADRASRYYAPFVHSAAALTFVGWLVATGSVHAAAVTAIAVLIITCPCALGLAIPAVHVAASSALMRKGLLLQEGDALERIGASDIVVFDKTGTLTRPEMELCNEDAIPPRLMEAAQRLALSSRHPVAQSLARGVRGLTPAVDAVETPGQGVSGTLDGVVSRLGSPAFTGLEKEAEVGLSAWPGATALGVVHGTERCVFLFRQQLRTDAHRAVQDLRKLGLDIAILSGDNEAAVAAVARSLGISDWRAGMTPAGKIAALDDMARKGRKVLMIGDGVNDAPALASAHASMAPASASHIAQNSADALFLGEALQPIGLAVEKARCARILMNQNLWFAIVYNIFAIPLAVAGLATPLVAAAAMSISSIVVSANAFRAAGIRDLLSTERRTKTEGQHTSGPAREPQLHKGQSA